jgi:hypothetical protein
MSGFTRDTKYYGDDLVYEALETKWRRHHDRCGCGEDWVRAHAEPAGFRVLRRRPGFVALVGPGLTEGVDEAALTTNALWEAVVGSPGTQDWFETVHVFPRDASNAGPAASSSTSDYYAARRERVEDAKTAPLTEAQSRYLSTLATKVSRERLDALYTQVTAGTTIDGRRDGEKTATMLARLTRPSARQLISLLVEGA